MGMLCRVLRGGLRAVLVILRLGRCLAGCYRLLRGIFILFCWMERRQGRNLTYLNVVCVRVCV